MGTVIRLSGFQTGRQRPASASLSRRPDQVGFTARDRADLERWSRSGRSISFCASEMGTFAMLYQDGQLWASWGAVRQGSVVLLWNCVTLADVGRFPTMTEALAFLPVDDDPVHFQNVVHFAARMQAGPYLS